MIGTDRDVVSSRNAVPSSCGAFLDAAAIAPITMTAGNITSGGGGEACHCLERDARFDLPGVQEIERGWAPENQGIEHDASVDVGGCLGQLLIGLTLDQRSNFADAGSNGIGQVLYRTFRASSDSDPSWVQAGLPRGVTGCFDAWAVSITDSRGRPQLLQ